MKEVNVTYPLSKTITCPYGTILAFLFQHHSDLMEERGDNREDKIAGMLQSALSAVQSINNDASRVLGDPRDGDNPFFVLRQLADITIIDKTFKELVDAMEVSVIFAPDVLFAFEMKEEPDHITRTIYKLQEKGIIKII